MKKIVLMVLCSGLVSLSFSQAVECIGDRIVGNKKPQTGSVEHYSIENLENPGDRLIWTIEGAVEVDGVSIDQFPDGKVMKRENDIAIRWGGQKKSSIEVERELPCQAQAARSKIIFPVTPQQAKPVKLEGSITPYRNRFYEYTINQDRCRDNSFTVLGEDETQVIYQREDEDGIIEVIRAEGDNIVVTQPYRNRFSVNWAIAPGSFSNPSGMIMYNGDRCGIVSGIRPDQQATLTVNPIKSPYFVGFLSPGKFCSNEGVDVNIIDAPSNAQAYAFKFKIPGIGQVITHFEQGAPPSSLKLDDILDLYGLSFEVGKIYEVEFLVIDALGRVSKFVQQVELFDSPTRPTGMEVIGELCDPNDVVEVRLLPKNARFTSVHWNPTRGTISATETTTLTNTMTLGQDNSITVQVYFENGPCYIPYAGDPSLRVFDTYAQGKPGAPTAPPDVAVSQFCKNLPFKLTLKNYDNHPVRWANYETMPTGLGKVETSFKDVFHEVNFEPSQGFPDEIKVDVTYGDCNSLFPLTTQVEIKNIHWKTCPIPPNDKSNSDEVEEPNADISFSTLSMSKTASIDLETANYGNHVYYIKINNRVIDEIKSIKVINSIGKVIREQNTQLVNLSAYATGIYAVVVTDKDGQTGTVKLVR